MTTAPNTSQFTAEELAAGKELINQIKESTKRKPHVKKDKIKVSKQKMRVRR
jgi:hypothetical protein